MQYSYISPKIEVRDSANGKGVFAKEKILKDELITDFSTGPGKYINTIEADKLYDKDEDYMIQVDDDLFFAATNESEMEATDYLNHSCNANCGIHGSLKIVAMRDIEPKEEITFDYCMSESSPSYSMKCNCQTSQCRGAVTGNDWKQKDLQEKYRG